MVERKRMFPKLTLDEILCLFYPVFYCCLSVICFLRIFCLDLSVDQPDLTVSGINVVLAMDDVAHDMLFLDSFFFLKLHFEIFLLKLR